MSTLSHQLSGVAYALWDADPRHLVDQVRQIEAALAAGRYGSARWTAFAMRDEEARARWVKRIEEAERER